MKAALAVAAQSGSAATARALLELAKPRITTMVLITTAAGWWLAPGAHALSVAAATLAGVALIVAGANAFNMYLERDVDALMKRTRSRPLPSGRLSPLAALGFGAVTSIAAVPLLTAGVNALTAMLALVSLLLYVSVYTPMKRHSTWSVAVGAIPGAMPPLMGWTAVTGRLDAGGVALFLVLFVWQLPHSVAISMFRADEYQAAGLKVVANVRGVQGAKDRIALYSVAMMLVSLHVVRAGIGGPFYLASALALGGGLVTLAIYGLQREAGGRWARWYFLYTLVYLPALMIALALSRN